jgi:hypothetical protein
MNAPLPPAKAAGVHNAQFLGGFPLALVAIGGGIGIIVAVALSNTSPTPVPNSAPVASGTNAGATV